jgi:hypothetical protein
VVAGLPAVVPGAAVVAVAGPGREAPPGLVEALVEPGDPAVTVALGLDWSPDVLAPPLVAVSSDPEAGPVAPVPPVAPDVLVERADRDEPCPQPARAMARARPRAAPPLETTRDMISRFGGSGAVTGA